MSRQRIALILPGGLDRASGRYIPVFESLITALAEHHEVVTYLTMQDAQPREERVGGARVVSLASNRTLGPLAHALDARKDCLNKGFVPDLVHSFWLGSPTLTGYGLARAFRTPLIASVCGGELIHLPELAYGGLRGLRGRARVRLSARVANRYTAGSNFLLAGVREQLSAPASVLPLGIDAGYWQQREPAGQAAQCNILYLASLNAVKQPSLMLAVAAQLKEQCLPFRITCIGVDTLAGEMQRLAHDTGVSGQVEFLGYRDMDDIRLHMEDQHFILQTSRFEAQGIAIMEGVSQGLCPVGTRVGWLADQGVGLPPDSPGLAQGIANEIVRYWGDPALRRSRVQPLQTVVKAQNSKATATALQEIYSGLSSNR